MVLELTHGGLKGNHKGPQGDRGRHSGLKGFPRKKDKKEKRKKESRQRINSEEND